MNYIFPFTPAWSNQRSIYQRRDEYEEKIRKAIEQDPQIMEPSKISVSLERGGMFHKNEFHLIGDVHSERDRRRAEEIVRQNAAGTTDIYNEIHVVETPPGFGLADSGTGI